MASAPPRSVPVASPVRVLRQRTSALARSVPISRFSHSAATNQLSGASYDANGNLTAGLTGSLAGGAFTYDVANRMTSAQESIGGIETYFYSPDNKQVYRMLRNGNEEITFYRASGEKLAVYGFGTGSYMPVLRSNVYFAGKMIWSDSAPVYQDRAWGGCIYYRLSSFNYLAPFPIVIVEWMRCAGL